jgi:hypothetical protein
VEIISTRWFGIGGNAFSATIVPRDRSLLGGIEICSTYGTRTHRPFGGRRQEAQPKADWPTAVFRATASFDDMKSGPADRRLPGHGIFDDMKA